MITKGSPLVAIVPVLRVVGCSGAPKNSSDDSRIPSGDHGKLTTLSGVEREADEYPTVSLPADGPSAFEGGCWGPPGPRVEVSLLLGRTNGSG